MKGNSYAFIFGVENIRYYFWYSYMKIKKKSTLARTKFFYTFRLLPTTGKIEIIVLGEIFMSLMGVVAFKGFVNRNRS